MDGVVQTNGLRVAVAAGLALWLSASGAGTGLGTGARLSEFRMRDGGQAGLQQWELVGREASLQGARVEMSAIVLTLRLRDGSRAVIKAPHCLFDTEERHGGSDRPIAVSHDKFELTGTGYEFWTDPQRVVIRRQVTMTLHGTGADLGNLLPAPRPTGADEGAKTNHEDDKP